MNITQKHKPGPRLLLVALALLLAILACQLPATTYPEDLQATGTHTASTPSGVDSTPSRQPAPTETVAPPAVPTAQLPTSGVPPKESPPTAVPPAEAVEPTTPPPGPLRLAVIGDFGLAGPAEQAVAELVRSWDPHYILTTGDNNYPTGAYETIDQNIGQYYHAYIGDYQGAYGPGADQNRFFPTLGNHDLDTDLGRPYFDYFSLPGNERYYDVLLGPVHVFALNSDWREPDGVGASSVQGQWLRDRLAASPAPWKLVVYHAAAYSSGHHGSTDWMRWPFKDWGATAALAGHDHLYERLLVDGFPYFTNGLGGGPIYNFNQPLPGSQARYNAGHGAMLITADESQITFQFFNISGELVDSYQLTR